MNADDVRLTAQLVVGKRVHAVSDAAVEAMARRVLELEADAEEHADNVRAVEREACANTASVAGYPSAAARIRARGAK